ncbi:MAG TPA: UDP-3-O-[3-hydroxymyristoyl] N-acetylglucosamine deacetylase [Firmicutes bacterium]|nr:UDP-3-O-[3-hydroxymyristoyl] N-acetylglucosamine deacetylase [Bacillota bacterium]
MKKMQQTIKEEVFARGQALHSGKTVEMRLLPQPVNTGIRFSRSDLPDKPVVEAKPENVFDTVKSMSLGNSKWHIQTIEHLMAALHGLGVDNLLVEVNGEELPLGDGSAWFFTELILKAGLVSQEAPRRIIKITKPIWVEDRKEPRSYLLALPGEGLRVSYCFTSDHQATGDQFCQYVITPETFQQHLARARTIAFENELAFLREQGLALGGSIEEAVVVGETGYLNELRYPNEIVRHKVLDILGDLYLLGPVEGQIIGVRSGHKMDYELTLKIKRAMEGGNYSGD